MCAGTCRASSKSRWWLQHSIPCSNSQASYESFGLLATHPCLLQHKQLWQQPLDAVAFGLLAAASSGLTATSEPWHLISSPCPITAKPKPLVQRGAGRGVGRAAASLGWAQILIPQQHQMAIANLHQLNLLPFWSLSTTREQREKMGQRWVLKYAWAPQASSFPKLKNSLSAAEQFSLRLYRCLGKLVSKIQRKPGSFWASAPDSCVFSCSEKLQIDKLHNSQLEASDFQGWWICPTLHFPRGRVRKNFNPLRYWKIIPIPN